MEHYNWNTEVETGFGSIDAAKITVERMSVDMSLFKPLFLNKAAKKNILIDRSHF